mgnify:CR=1 FL=1
MQFNETFRIAIESLLINRLRSILTTLGIVIGVGAVISLVGLGRGVEDYIDQEFAALGADILEINSTQPDSPTRTRIEPLTTLEARDLGNPLIAPSLRAVAIRYGVFGQLVNGAERTQLGIDGVSSNYAEVQQWPIRSGRFITEDDIENNGRVIVLGLDVVEDLFGSRDFNAVGQIVRLNQRPFTVVGIMSQRGGTFVSEDNAAFIPISTAQTRLDNARTRDGGFRVNTIYAQVRSEDVIPQAESEIIRYLDPAHDVTFEDERDYSVGTETGFIDLINEASSVLTLFLIMIASISLLVGGIGIMNIMLVSVTERTKEIGLRKAVGARGIDILSQFLIESTILSLLGGLIGIFVGAGVGALGTVIIRDIFNQPIEVGVSLDAVLLATGVSTFVGVFFGYYPASRAARMKPIDALRFE